MWPQDMQLEGSWGVFKLSLNSLWALFGLPWASFGLLWGALGAPWEHFGTTFGAKVTKISTLWHPKAPIKHPNIDNLTNQPESYSILV